MLNSMLKDKLDSLAQSLVSSLMETLSSVPLSDLFGEESSKSARTKAVHALGEAGRVPKKRGGRRGKRGSVDKSVARLVDFMKAHRTKEGHTTADLCAAVSLSRNQWKGVIERAKAQKHVVQKGKKRSSRYFYKA